MASSLFVFTLVFVNQSREYRGNSCKPVTNLYHRHMMKIFLCVTFAVSGLASAAPTDTELLTLVKDRAKLERVTPQPKKIDAKLLQRCASPAPSVLPSPHEGGSIHVYTSDSAAQAYFDPWGKFPEGSLVLKEKLTGEALKTEEFTGMLKREAGYFPEGGDWEYFTVDAAAAKIGERGKLKSCAECHANQAKVDRITKLSAAAVQLTSGKIMLHSSKAEAHGEKLHYEELEKKNTLGFWVNPADWAEWKFNVTQPGTYAIHIWQGCGKGSGGAEIEISCAGQANKFIVDDTGHFQNFKEREVGTIKFDKPGARTLELRAKTKPGGAVMDCRQIILVPVKTEAK